MPTHQSAGSSFVELVYHAGTDLQCNKSNNQSPSHTQGALHLSQADGGAEQQMEGVVFGRCSQSCLITALHLRTAGSFSWAPSKAQSWACGKMPSRVAYVEVLFLLVVTMELHCPSKAVPSGNSETSSVTVVQLAGKFMSWGLAPLPFLGSDRSTALGTAGQQEGHFSTPVHPHATAHWAVMESRRNRQLARCMLSCMLRPHTSMMSDAMGTCSV